MIGDFGKRSMGLNGIIYPYWENAVRLTEDYAALLLVLTVLFAVTPAVSVTVTAVRWLRKLWKKGRSAVKTRITDGIEHHREQKWQAAAGKKE